MSEQITVNGETRTLEARDLAQLIFELDLDPHRAGIAVAVNGAVVPRSEWTTHALRPGDEVEVVGAVQGG